MYTGVQQPNFPKITLACGVDTGLKKECSEQENLGDSDLGDRGQ